MAARNGRKQPDDHYWNSRMNSTDPVEAREHLASVEEFMTTVEVDVRELELESTSSLTRRGNALW
jgi:hypothetical protein